MVRSNYNIGLICLLLSTAAHNDPIIHTLSCIVQVFGECMSSSFRKLTMESFSTFTGKAKPTRLTNIGRLPFESKLRWL